MTEITIKLDSDIAEALANTLLAAVAAERKRQEARELDNQKTIRRLGNKAGFYVRRRDRGIELERKTGAGRKVFDTWNEVGQFLLDAALKRGNA